MLSGYRRLFFLFALVCVSFAHTQFAHAAAPSAPKLVLNQLGKGSAPLDGPWQFHLGDDPMWAQPTYDDSQWEQLTADAPWGSQTHPSNTGYAWYRKHITLSPAEGASPDIALLIPAIDDVYALYWNGVPVGHLGSFPPKVDWMSAIPAQTYGLGPVRGDGVLAVRVYKAPLATNDDGTAGGFEGLPIIGSPEAIRAIKDAADYRWLQKQQFRFGLTLLYGLTMLFSLFAWLRDRKERLLFWMMVYTSMPLLELLLLGLRLPFSAIWQTFLTQGAIQFREISQWFLLIWLLQLNQQTKLVKWVRIAAYISLAAGVLDGSLGFIFPSILSDGSFQSADAILTFFILPSEIIPALLVIYAVMRRQKLDSARWVVATVATVNALFYSVSNITAQGVRFTHWTLAAKMTAPLFTLFGSVFVPLMILRTLLFLSIVYAVIRYSVENRRRQTTLEQEFQNARVLQQVLMPETLPTLPGFTLTSAYRPAQEVGGDFFQIVPLEGDYAGSALVILGDVSGKGLRAAMAVSLVVGMIRALADHVSGPGELLAELNRRLYGRLQGGFVTCIALRLDSDSICLVSSAGHPPLVINGHELGFSGSLPLGLVAQDAYEEGCLRLKAGDHLALYTDGLLEAKNTSGELYGFDRLHTLFAARPDAAKAVDAAVSFGQDDDITVLTLVRLATGQESTTTISMPAFARRSA